MKKITLLFIILLFNTLSEAQVIASQNFDTSLGWTSSVAGSWARRTTGGAPACSTFAGLGMARFNSYDLAAGSTARLTSPMITFTGNTYRVKLKMYRDSGYPTDADNIKVYVNTTNAAGGSLLGTVNRSKSLAPVEAADGWYSYSFDIAGAITGTRYINILGTGQYGNNIFIDEISVEQVPLLDGEMKSVGFDPIITAGMTNITGVVKNYGSTPITSMDLMWQVDSGAIYTQNMTGLNIAASQTYAFTHNTQWNAIPGLYSVKVWVANINGSSTDSDATNDQIIKSVSVASNSTTRFPLYEKFTSSTCGPCASFNGNYFSPFYTQNSSELALINYQVNWPGNGDPYYTAEVGTRVAYYGVSGAPTLYVDSKEGTNFSISGLNSDLNTAVALPAYFSLTASQTLIGSDLTVNVTTTPYLSGAYKLYVAVVEKLTTNNAATNGETSFKNVFMKMLPNAAGTIIDFTYDVPVTTQLQANLNGLNIEQMSDLEIIVFIQNAATKAVMQTKIASNALATNEFSLGSKVKLYPNPSNGIVKIATQNPVNVIVSDMTGKVVFTMENAANESEMNLSQLQKGIYLAKIVGDNGEQTQKIILQ